MADPVAWFAEKTAGLEYKPKAIFPSEMFLFCEQCIYYAIDHIMESGVGYGGSTQCLMTVFPTTRITSVDDDHYGQFDKVKLSIKRAERTVELFKGNSVQMLPELVRQSDARRIAVLIDGPKRDAAVALADRLLKQDARVKFAAIHDLPDGMGRRGSFSSRVIIGDSVRERLDAKVGEYRKFYPFGPGLTFFLQETPA